MTVPYFYDNQIRKYIQQVIRLFGGFSVEMGKHPTTGGPLYQEVPVRYGDSSRMAAHIVRENSENMTGTVPFISCYVTELMLAPERRLDMQHVEKVQVVEKEIDDATGKYINKEGDRYTIERHMPVPYNMTMNVDVWTSNTDQKLQLFEQLGVLFNPSLNIHTNNNAFDWSSLSYVENTNIIWSSRSVGSNIDDMIDVMTLTYSMPILINPPAKLKHQKLIHTIINRLNTLDNDDLDAYRESKDFNISNTQYVITTHEDRKLRYENNKIFLLNNNNGSHDPEGNILDWTTELQPFGILKEGISQLRLRKGDDISDRGDDIIGRLSFDSNDPNALIVEIDTDTLPTNTLTAITAIVDPLNNYPGDGTVPSPQVGQRYLITSDLPISNNWSNIQASNNDIIEFNGTGWIISFDSSTITTIQYIFNSTTMDQLEWDGIKWFNSHEGIYNAGYWRLYL
jgi:hypothetical protein